MNTRREGLLGDIWEAAYHSYLNSKFASTPGVIDGMLNPMSQGNTSVKVFEYYSLDQEPSSLIPEVHLWLLLIHASEFLQLSLYSLFPPWSGPACPGIYS